MKRVVITGSGPVSAIGIGHECFTEGLLEGASGIMEISAFEHGRYGAHLAATVEDFDVNEFLPAPKNYLDRNTALSFGAFSLALKSSGLDLSRLDKSGIALIWGTAFGGTETMNLFYSDIQKKGPRFGKPILFPHTYSNTAISFLSIDYKLNGPHMNFSSGYCASGQALAYGYDMVASGRIPAAFVGGAESFSETLFRFLLSKNILSPSAGPDACSPFGKTAGGTVAGEGAGMLVLEELESAQKRGAPIFAELSGVGLAGSPGGLDSDAVEQAMQAALSNSGITPSDVDCVIASANGIPQIDRAEAAAISGIFGPGKLATSVKPLLGETFGAAGILQAHAAISMLEKQFVPGIKTLSRIPGAEAIQLLPEASTRTLKALLLNNLDPAGNAVSMLLKNFVT